MFTDRNWMPDNNFNGVRVIGLDIYKAKEDSNDFERIVQKNKSITSIAQMTLNDFKVADTSVERFKGCHLELDPTKPCNAFVVNEQDKIVGGVFSSTIIVTPMAVEGSEEETRRFFDKINTHYSKNDGAE